MYYSTKYIRSGVLTKKSAIQLWAYKYKKKVLLNPIVIHSSPEKGCRNESKLGGAFVGTVYTREIPVNIYITLLLFIEGNIYVINLNF